MKSALLPLGLLLCVLGTGAVHAETFPGTNLGGIADGTASAPRSYGAARDVRFEVVGSVGTIASVQVGFSANHGRVGDLKVRLIAPNGQEHLLFERTGAVTADDSGSVANLSGAQTYGFGDGFATNWWDAIPPGDADIPSVDARTVVAGGAGVSAPATSMDAKFRSTPPNGTWILRFEDGAANETGDVTAATLTLTTAGTTRTVTTAADSGAGSLREQIGAAADGDLIVFASPLFDAPQTIELLSALPDLEVDLALHGPGANLLTVRRADAAPHFRIFRAPGFDTTLSIGGMTVSNGRDTSGSGGSANGGGMTITGDLTLYGVHVTGNRAAGGGGGVLLNGANGTFIDSTFSANQVDGFGGAIVFQAAQTTLRIVNCTISGNTAQAAAAVHILAFLAFDSQVDIVNSTIQGNTGMADAALRIDASGGANTLATLRNSIVADNPGGNLFVQASGGTGDFVSLGFNLGNDDGDGFLDQPSDQLNADAGLAALADNGGATPTHALQSTSDALDAGNNNQQGITADQRGGTFARTVDLPLADAIGSDGTDIGAFEAQTQPLSDAIFADGFED